MVKTWYLPQIYNAGIKHTELITIIIAAFMGYALIVVIVQKAPRPIIGILVWNYLILVLSSHGLLINEVHIFESSFLNNTFLYVLCLATSIVLIVATIAPPSRTIPSAQYSIKLIILLPFIIAAIQGLRRILGIRQELSLIIKILLIILALPIGYWLTKINFCRYWDLLRKSKIFGQALAAISIGFIIFFITGLIQTPVFQTAKKQTVFDFKKINLLTVEKQNILFLVLDEFSPEYLEQLLVPIVESKIDYRIGTIAAPTGMTLDAIPTLLSGDLYLGMTVCGFSTICSTSKKFDFSKLKAYDSDVDVIGMHHAYCSIKNLRSCYTFSAFHREPIVDFLCQLQNLLSQLTPKRLENKLLSCFTGVRYREKNLKQAIRAANQMTFWNDGGVLYMHLPLPHPALEEIDAGSVRLELHDHYKGNIAKASKIVSDFLVRLASRFNNNFTLIITSDHSLRLGMWCDYDFECNPKPKILSGAVPFIVISPNLNPDAVLPKSQLNIFNN